ncbi:MAG TPA: two-component regulator propeller domain-containing protein, partial [Candidatus Eisenbacteria bacterium]|nr:two-component regulator propeller domain-containing protein [Candidatus Eisenbacteria bacterium]
MTRAIAITALVLLAALLPVRAAAATRIFVTNHVNSNDVRGLAAWDGRLAAATLGGVVLAGMPAGPFTKVMRTAGGLPSNQTLCLVASPAGRLWIGTVDQGLARLRTDGSFPRTLTTFDGLPSNRVQTLFRTGDSVWVGTSGGVALFTENPTNGQVALRRSDSNASTAGGLISDDIRAFASLRDTTWCATGAGLSAFTGGSWIPRGDLLATAANALLAHGDTLWVGTAAGPRAYVNGVLEPVGAGHFGSCLAIG